MVRAAGSISLALATLAGGAGLARAQGLSADPSSGRSLGRQRSTIERLAPERLAAAHADVARLRQLREHASHLPEIEGLHDYRAIFHAHAGDSDHTGGTLTEILAGARAAGVDAIFLADHHRPPRDFMDSWRGVHDGVLFVRGAEARGVLLLPEHSIAGEMDAPIDELIAAASAGSGLVLLSHVEERPEHPLDGLHGMEIYNRHADAKDEGASMRDLLGWMLDPDHSARLRRSLERYPDEVFASQYDYPALYLEKWDREGRHRRVVAVAANDCHHNQVFLVKKLDAETALLGTVVDEDDEMQRVTAADAPRLGELLAGAAAGSVVARFDFDPYERAMRDVSTHLLAQEQSERALREALRSGRSYVSHDWLADPTGFWFGARDAAGRRVAMGAEVPHEPGLRLEARTPIPARLRLLRDGETLEVAHGERLEAEVEGPGVYRLEAWLPIGGEQRVWIYSSPIYVRSPPGDRAARR
jgi:hypothetical protein